MSTIIALYASRPQVGKTTIARFLRDRHGFTIVSFADALRSICTRSLIEAGCPSGKAALILSVEKDVPQKALGGKTGRDVLIAVGQAYRSINPDWWVECAMNHVRGLDLDGRDVVIDDLRFPNEFDTLRSHRAHLVHVVGDRGLDGIGGEGQLDDRDFDYAISNTRRTSLEDLAEKVSLVLTDAQSRAPRSPRSI